MSLFNERRKELTRGESSANAERESVCNSPGERAVSSASDSLLYSSSTNTSFEAIGGTQNILDVWDLEGEISQLQFTVKKLRDESSSLKEQISSLQDENLLLLFEKESLDRKLSQRDLAHDKINQLRKELEGSKQSICSAQDMNRILVNRITRLERDYSNIETKHNNLIKKSEGVKGELEKSELKLKSKEEEIQKLKAASAELISRFEEKEKLMDEKMNDLNETIKDLTNTTNDLLKEKFELESNFLEITPNHPTHQQQTSHDNGDVSNSNLRRNLQKSLQAEFAATIERRRSSLLLQTFCNSSFQLADTHTQTDISALQQEDLVTQENSHLLMNAKGEKYLKILDLIKDITELTIHRSEIEGMKKTNEMGICNDGLFLENIQSDESSGEENKNDEILLRIQEQLTKILQRLKSEKLFCMVGLGSMEKVSGSSLGRNCDNLDERLISCSTQTQTSFTTDTFKAGNVTNIVTSQNVLDKLPKIEISNEQESMVTLLENYTEIEEHSLWGPPLPMHNRSKSIPIGVVPESDRQRMIKYAYCPVLRSSEAEAGVLSGQEWRTLRKDCDLKAKINYRKRFAQEEANEVEGSSSNSQRFSNYNPTDLTEEAEEYSEKFPQLVQLLFKHLDIFKSTSKGPTELDFETASKRFSQLSLTFKTEHENLKELKSWKSKQLDFAQTRMEEILNSLSNSIEKVSVVGKVDGNENIAEKISELSTSLRHIQGDLQIEYKNLAATSRRVGMIEVESRVYKMIEVMVFYVNILRNLYDQLQKDYDQSKLQLQEQINSRLKKPRLSIWNNNNNETIAVPNKKRTVVDSTSTQRNEEGKREEILQQHFLGPKKSSVGLGFDSKLKHKWIPKDTSSFTNLILRYTSELYDALRCELFWPWNWHQTSQGLKQTFSILLMLIGLFIIFQSLFPILNSNHAL